MWIDPVAMQIGPVAIRWYGIAWASAFLLLLYFPSRLVKESKVLTNHWHDIVSNALIASVIGGRVGEMLIYQFNALKSNPLKIFMIWEGGMSFHGALLLGALTLAWMARRLKVEFLVITDAAVVNLPLALGLVRIANFINAELVGRITDQSWGVQFPAYGPLLRHPSQLYEAFLEGLVLFAIMRYSANRKLPKGYLSAIFTSSYAVMRLLVESYYREPTYDLTYFASTGQILCSLMLIVGILMGVYCWKEYSQR